MRRLALKVDALLVIGGTSEREHPRLYTAAAASGRPCWHIEGASDLPDGMSSFAKVGITAGRVNA